MPASPIDSASSAHQTAVRLRPVQWHGLALVVLLGGLSAWSSVAHANSDPIRGFVERNLPASAAPVGARIEVSVGSLDPRLQLAPCQRVEPYLLAGTRLWGRTSIGVRCIEGANWTVTLPVTVTIRGMAVVAAEPMAAGNPAAINTVRIEEAELTREAGTPITDPAQLQGKTLMRGVAAGQVLRMEYFRSTPSVAVGDPVRIDMIGRGFMIQAEGQALAPGAEGQTLRVRTENGRIVAGVLRGRTVEIRI